MQHKNSLVAKLETTVKSTSQEVMKVNGTARATTIHVTNKQIIPVRKQTNYGCKNSCGAVFKVSET